MPKEPPQNPNGEDADPFGGLTGAVFGQALSEAAAVLTSQLVTAAGLAMQNIVAHQQTLYTINNAIATKALNLLVEKDPAAALAEIHNKTPTEVVDALQQLSKLINSLNPSAPPPSAPGHK
jgi:hypothetical protein